MSKDNRSNRIRNLYKILSYLYKCDNHNGDYIKDAAGHYFEYIQTRSFNLNCEIVLYNNSKTKSEKLADLVGLIQEFYSSKSSNVSSLNNFFYTYPPNDIIILCDINSKNMTIKNADIEYITKNHFIRDTDAYILDKMFKIERMDLDE